MKRISWIDSLKAFGILLIVWGHFIIDSFPERIMYSFHVPLFFFLSGFLFTIKQDKSFLQEFFARIKTIVIPYWCYIIIFIPITIYLVESPVDAVIHDLTFYQGSLTWNTPLWFLPELFLTWLFCYGLLKFKDHIYTIMIAIAVCILIASCRAYFPESFKAFGFIRAFAVIPFFLLGYCFKKYNILRFVKKNRPGRISIIFFILIGIVFGMILNPQVAIYGYDYETYLFLFIGASAFSCALTILFSRIKRHLQILRSIGKNTVFILATHMPLVLLYMAKVHPLVENNTSVRTILTLTISVVIIALQSLICLLLRKSKVISFLLGLR